MHHTNPLKLKTMKKLMLTTAVILAGFIGTQAQMSSTGMPMPGPNGDKMLEKITTSCNLTPEQKTKVTPFVKDFVQGRMANKQKYANDPAGMKAANKANREKFMGDMKGVLSADQMKKMEDMKMEKNGGKMGGTGEGMNEKE